jgi:hypothetical protein
LTGSAAAGYYFLTEDFFDRIQSMLAYSPRALRARLIAVFVLLIVLFAASSGYSQRGRSPGQPVTPPPQPAFQPPQYVPPSSPPVVIQEWRCESCKQVLGTGSSPPNISKCPHCGTRFGYYQDFDGTKHDMPSSSTLSESDREKIQNVVMVILGLILVPGVVIGMIFLAKSTVHNERSPRRARPRRSSRRRDEDDDRSVPATRRDDRF